MLPTDAFFSDIEKIIAECGDTDRTRMQLILQELERIASRVPRVADRCYAYQARLYVKLGAYNQAQAAIERALQIMPLDEGLLLLRGDIHRQAEEFSKALGDYSRVVEANPDAVTARMRRAEVQQESGRLDAALQDINDALKHEPRSLRLIYRRALILIDLRRATEAIADLRAVARFSPDEDLKRKAEQRLRELGER